MPGHEGDSSLLKKLRELSQREGVRRLNLYDFLGPELRALWHINEGPAERVRAMVTVQLERLIRQLPDDSYRAVARYSYNITGDPSVESLDLGERHKLLYHRDRGPSAENSRRYMRTLILPEFERSLRASPPAPVSPEEMAALLGPGHESVATPERLATVAPDEVDPRSSRASVPRLAIAGLVVLVLGGLTAVLLIVLAQLGNDGRSSLENPPTSSGRIPTFSNTPDPSTVSSSPPSPWTPRRTYREVGGNRHGSPTFKYPYTPSVTGPKVRFLQAVQVGCKVLAPSIESVLPDGYWYRIMSPPWNGEYYSPANTFLNGDKVGGFTVHNTDFKVPDCPSGTVPDLATEQVPQPTGSH